MTKPAKEKHGWAAKVMALLLAALWLGTGYVLAAGELPDVWTAFAAYSGPSVSARADAFYTGAEAQVTSSDYRNAAKDIYAALQTAQGKRELRNFYLIRDKEGFLYTGDFYGTYDMGMEMYAERLAVMHDTLQQSAASSPFLFVGTASRQGDAQAAAMAGYPLSLNAVRQMDELLFRLFGKQIDTLDLRFTAMHAMPREEMFYRTDPHWTTTAAFQAFVHIVDCLQAQYGLVLDPGGIYRNPDNYVVERYEDAFLGEYGQSAGIYISGMEDFVLIRPAAPSSFLLHEGVGAGDFFDTLLFQQLLGAGNAYDSQPTNVYLGRDSFSRTITNHSLPNGPKLLLIGDSNFKPVAAFLAQLCSELVFLNPLEAGEGDSIEAYLENNVYDGVIVACSPESVGEAFFPYYAEAASMNMPVPGL